MRDRLIDLLLSKSCRNKECPDVQCDECPNLAVFEGDAEKIADAILADGWMRPPCKVGSYVYCRVEGFSQLLKGRVRQITIFKDDCFIFEVAINGYYAQKYTNKDFGKNVFFSEEEAMQALRDGVQ